MTDTPIKEGNDNSVDKGGDAPETSYQKLKVANEKLEEKLQAQETLTAAERRKTDERIKELEIASKEPKEDVDRIAALEVQLARSKAVSRYGLSEDDAELLKGSPEDIIKDAEYWANRLKDTNVKDDTDVNNRDMIDKKVDGANDPPPPNPPKPKKETLSWLDRYKAGTPAERYKMDERVLSGIDDPNK